MTTATSAPTQTASTSSTTDSGTATVKKPAHPRSPSAAVKLLLLASSPHTGCSSDVVTEHYLRAAYGGRGACLKAVSSKSTAQSLGGGVADVSGDKATVTVHPVGGIYDGEKITVSLVRSDGGWQVDGIKSNAPVGP